MEEFLLQVLLLILDVLLLHLQEFQLLLQLLVAAVQVLQVLRLRPQEERPVWGRDTDSAGISS